MRGPSKSLRESGGPESRWLYADGTPRIETHHWENAKPAVLEENQEPATKKKLGRKPKPAKGDTPSDNTNNTASIPNDNIMPEKDNERPK